MAFLALVLSRKGTIVSKPAQKADKSTKNILYTQVRAHFSSKKYLFAQKKSNFQFSIFKSKILFVSLYAKLGILWLERKYRSMVSSV